MCPGAEGWRTHWKKQIDRVIRNYDFDGIYFDFWYGRIACENTRHGCGGRFRRGTVLGSRRDADVRVQPAEGEGSEGDHQSEYQYARHRHDHQPGRHTARGRGDRCGRDG